MTMVVTAYQDAGVLLQHLDGAAVRYLLEKQTKPLSDNTWAAILNRGLALRKQEKSVLLYADGSDIDNILE